MSPDSPQHSGGCLCRAVRFVATAEPLGVRQCWCRLCQHLAAGNATVNVIFPAEAVTITGETRDYVSTADSGNIMHRRFCPSCGSPLFSASAARSHLLIIRVGAMDQPEKFAPQTVIWTKAAPPWACIDPGLPQIPGQP
jgi:hypothetical protein